MADECNSDRKDTVVAATGAVSGAAGAAALGSRYVPMASGQSNVVVGDDDDASKTVATQEGKNESAKESDEFVIHDLVEHIKDLVEDGRTGGSEDKKMFMAEFYKSLPVDWDGAPEFQWRLVKDDSDRRVIIFENVLPADMFDPWLYSALLRAKRVLMEFPRSAGKVDPTFENLYGRVEAYFQSDHPIAYCTVNNLVHIRTGAHRVKIYLPQTKWVRRYKDILESRLGRMREPLESMRFLVLKPISDAITEEQIREIAFKNYPIETVCFEKDYMEQRMAILSFRTAREAVAAHANNDFVTFGSKDSPSDYIKVYFPNVDFHGWDKLALPTPETDTHYLLTYKEFIAATQTKKNDQEHERLSKISASKEAKQTRTDAVKVVQERKRSIDAASGEGEDNKHPEEEGAKPLACEGIQPVEKSISRNLQTKTFPKKTSKAPGDAKRVADADSGGPSRKRRRAGRYRRRRSDYNRSSSSSSSYRNIPPFALPPARYGGGSYRVEPWRRPPQPAPFPYGPAFDSYGYEARRRKPPTKLPIMDVAVADAHPPPPRPLNELSLLERRKELDLQEHILRQQKVIDDLAKKLSTQNNAPTYARPPEMHDPYSAIQAPAVPPPPAAASTSTSKMPAWVTPSIYSQSGSAETYEAWR